MRKYTLNDMFRLIGMELLVHDYHDVSAMFPIFTSLNYNLFHKSLMRKTNTKSI